MISGQSPEDLHERRLRDRGEEVSLSIGMKAASESVVQSGDEEPETEEK